MLNNVTGPGDEKILKFADHLISSTLMRCSSERLNTRW